jgi:hypothetical protein
MSTIELTNGSATLTARADYLLVVEHGTLTTADEVVRYVTEVEMAGQRFQLRRLLVDARSESEEVEGRGEARAAMWRWIRTQRAFDGIGYVLRDEMMIARVNMTALSERLPIRAFAAVAEGHRWLARPRQSSTAVASARGSSSVPPPPMPGRTPAPGRPPTPTPPGSVTGASFGRTTARIRAMSSEEADAVLASRPSTPPSGGRTTVKIAPIDDKTAADVLAGTPPPSRKPSR